MKNKIKNISHAPINKILIEFEQPYNNEVVLKLKSMDIGSVYTTTEKVITIFAKEDTVSLDGVISKIKKAFDEVK